MSAPAPVSTVVGNVYRSEVEFYNDATPPVLIDPVEVLFVARNPATGVLTEHTYGDTDAYAIVRESVGKYVGYHLLTAPGNWFFRWEGTGAMQGASEEQAIVRPSRVRIA